jgi:Ca2+-binding RTX toxin-like protein
MAFRPFGYERPKTQISEEQRENVKQLFTDLQNSIDNPPSEASLNQLKSSFREAFSDRNLTTEELATITEDVILVVQSAGVTPTEMRTIFYDLQNIAEASQLPHTDDMIMGTTEDDILFGGLGNDTLTGTDSTGTSEVDWLTGGGGQDTFVLGDAELAFYQDGRPNSPGIGDFAAVLDFNPQQDIIQLHGTADDYSLKQFSVQGGVTGTAIYLDGATPVPELVGAVVGVSLADFSNGFSFTQ